MTGTWAIWALILVDGQWHRDFSCEEFEAEVVEVNLVVVVD